MASILLVDDEKVARVMYSDFLSQAGHAVTSVANFREAVSCLTSAPFDVVVTDLILPQGSGMELLQFCKERQVGTEVIVITALDKVDPAVRAIKSGAAEYLVKPVGPEALSHAVARALTTRQLLNENASLRRHVELLETGQRLATTLDRERLSHVALSSFAQVTHAQGVLLYSRLAQGNVTQEGMFGLDDAQANAFGEAAGAFAASVFENNGPAMAQGQKVTSLPLPPPFRAALAQPAVDSQNALGLALLLFQHELSTGAEEAASFVARHWAMALKNLGRFAEVEDLAYIDDLTSLYNSRYLELVMDREASHALSHQKTFSLLFLDLDYFKSVNDSHGHLVGSKLLVEVARIIKGCVRDNDVVCRWGGDEYVVLLRGTDSGGALKVAERIRRSVEAHAFLVKEGLSVSVTTCIGVASFPEHAKDVKTLLDFADRAMYRGKKGSRNVIYMAAVGMEATPVQRHVQLKNR